MRNARLLVLRIAHYVGIGPTLSTTSYLLRTLERGDRGGGRGEVRRAPPRLGSRRAYRYAVARLRSLVAGELASF